MNIKSSPAWSIKGKSPAQKIEEIPGPGAYHLSDGLYNTRSTISLGKTERIRLNPGLEIGPGAYDPQRHESYKAAIFGTASRDQINNLDSTPGPGDYQIIHKSDKGIRFSQTTKSLRVLNANLPGPGRYDPITILKSTPGCKFSRQKREKSSEALIPGPGAYDTERVNDKGSWKFASSSRERVKQGNSPGPGSYDIPDSRDKRSSFLLGKSLQKLGDSIPGPGAYDINKKIENRSISVGKSIRFKSKLHLVPGPGNYNNETKEQVTGVIFTKAKRDENSPKTTRYNFPGPGNYSPKERSDSPGWKFSTEKRVTSQIAKNPGPGAYNIPDSRDTRGFLLSSSRREIFNRSETPGPGNYSLTSSKVGPAYSIQYKKNEKSEKLGPGPGEYDVSSEKSKSVAIGKTKRFELTHKEKLMRILPGPGNYDTKEPKANNGWRFGSQKRSQSRGKDTPGPGQYDYKSSIPNVPAYLLKQ